MLEAAGVSSETGTHDIDESAIKSELTTKGIQPGDLAEDLARAKAEGLSRSAGQVLGADQILAMENGTMLDKPANKDDAKTHLRILSGRAHRLYSAAAIVEQGRPVWHHVDMATLTMRNLSEKFIEDYVEAEWDSIRYCVGCYEIEGSGIQLFSRIEGSQFTIMGLPLIGLLGYLRERGLMPS